MQQTNKQNVIKKHISLSIYRKIRLVKNTNIAKQAEILEDEGRRKNKQERERC